MLGHIVSYRLTHADADQVNRRRINPEEVRRQLFLGHWPAGAQAHVGEFVLSGEELPMIVTKAEHSLGIDGPSTLSLSGQVFLNGNDTLFVAGRYEGDAPGNWTRL